MYCGCCSSTMVPNEHWQHHRRVHFCTVLTLSEHTVRTLSQAGRPTKRRMGRNNGGGGENDGVVQYRHAARNTEGIVARGAKAAGGGEAAVLVSALPSADMIAK